MKNAIVTGSSKGLGKSIAEALAAKGYRVWISARNENELEQCKKEIEATTRGKVMVDAVDYMDSHAVEHYAKKLHEQCPTVDVLVNNAGIYVPDTLLDQESKLEAHMRVNFETAYTITQHLLPRMAEQRAGFIFNVCSVVNRQPRISASSYTISKFALWGYHQLLHKTMLAHQVKVCGFFPSSINTSSWDGANAPVDEFVQPEDIALLITTIMEMKAGTVPSEIDLSAINPNF